MSDRNSETDLPPGYYWGTEQAPPDDADTADTVEVKVTYGVKVHEDGDWRWSGVNLPDLQWATDHAEHYKGVNNPVPVHRLVVQVTRTYYGWDDRGWGATEEVHDVLSEHTYTGPADPFSD